MRIDRVGPMEATVSARSDDAASPLAETGREPVLARPDEALLVEQQQGRLEQSCALCGRWEAAGAYCTGCFAPMTARDWYRNGDLTRRHA